MKERLKNHAIVFLILAVVGVSAFLMTEKMQEHRMAKHATMNAQLEMLRLKHETRKKIE